MTNQPAIACPLVGFALQLLIQVGFFIIYYLASYPLFTKFAPDLSSLNYRISFDEYSLYLGYFIFLMLLASVTKDAFMARPRRAQAGDVGVEPPVPEPDSMADVVGTRPRVERQPRRRRRTQPPPAGTDKPTA